MTVHFPAILLAAALQATGSAAPPVTRPNSNGPVEPVHRAAPLSTAEAEQLSVRKLADRSFEQLSDAVVAAWHPAGLASNVALTSLDFMLQPTGAGIGGLCRSTEVTVQFGREQGRGTLPMPPETRATARRAEDVTSRKVFKIAGPLHRLRTVEAQYAWDATCAQRRDAQSFMVTDLPNEDSLIPALIGIEQALEQRRQALAETADFFDLAPAWGGHVRLFAPENVATVRGVVEGDHIASLEVIFAPGGIDNGMGAKMTIRNVAWHWPAFDSPDYGVPSVTIGTVAIQPHQVIYD